MSRQLVNISSINIGHKFKLKKRTMQNSRSIMELTNRRQKFFPRRFQICVRFFYYYLTIIFLKFIKYFLSLRILSFVQFMWSRKESFQIFKICTRVLPSQFLDIFMHIIVFHRTVNKTSS